MSKLHHISRRFGSQDSARRAVSALVSSLLDYVEVHATGDVRNGRLAPFTVSVTVDNLDDKVLAVSLMGAFGALSPTMAEDSAIGFEDSNWHPRVLTWGDEKWGSVDPTVMIPSSIRVYSDGSALAVHDGEVSKPFPSLSELSTTYRIDVH